MKTSRKLVVALTLAAMIATMIGTGVVSAAPTVQQSAFTDIADNKYADAINWIAALGIINGRPGGIYDPNAPITREEMAKIIVGFIGQASLADQLSANGVQFKDAKQVQDWAVGWVNAAQALGIIQGYPDGTFRPLANVTAQEALTMIIRALGDECQVVEAGNHYPGSNLSAAAILGISSGVNFAGALAADRGMVAKFIFNAGDAPRYTPIFKTGSDEIARCDKTTAGQNGTVFDTVFKDQIVLSDFGQHGTTYVVTGVDATNGVLYLQEWKDNALQSTFSVPLASKVTLLGTDKLSGLVGSTVNYALNGDGQATLVEIAKAPTSKTISGKLNSSKSAVDANHYATVDAAAYGYWYLKPASGTGLDSSIRYVLFADGTLTQLTTDATFQLNGQDQGNKSDTLDQKVSALVTALGSNGGGKSAIITLSGGLGSKVNVQTVNDANVIADSANDSWSDAGTNLGVLHRESGALKSYTITFTSDTDVTFNGQSMSAKDAYAKIKSDLAAGVYPVLQVSWSSKGAPDVGSVSITDTQVTGTVTDVQVTADGATLTIGGTTATVSGAFQSAAARADGESLSSALPGVGDSVLALLVNGSVVYTFGTPATVAQNELVNVTGISTSGGKIMATFDYRGSSYTVQLASLDATTGVGYSLAQPTSPPSEKATITNLAPIGDPVNGVHEFSVKTIQVTNGVVTSLVLNDEVLDPGDKSNTGDLTIPVGSSGQNYKDRKFEVYSSDGKWLGSVSGGATYVVYSDTGDASGTWFILEQQ